jgi:hypothetical protein
MILVITLLVVWLTIHVLVALPRKFPLPVNVLLYMALSIMNINQITILGFKYRLFVYNQRIPEYLATLLQRDFTFSLSLLIFANAFLCASKRMTKVWVSLWTFLFLFGTGQILRVMDAITYKKWNIFCQLPPLTTSCLKSGLVPNQQSNRFL